jgi:hypothetical protein
MLGGNQRRVANPRADNMNREGFREAKDTRYDLDVEIGKKIAKGYPLNNIFFEDMGAVVRIENASKCVRAVGTRGRLAIPHVGGCHDTRSLHLVLFDEVAGFGRFQETKDHHILMVRRIDVFFGDERLARGHEVPRR